MSDLEPTPASGIAALQGGGLPVIGRTRVPSACTRAVALAALILLAITHPAAAQAPSDFYSAPSSKDGTSLLEQVEKYHLNPGISNLRAGKYEYAYPEVAFILKYFPNHPRALLLMSEICVKWKQPARCNADQYFQKAISLNPEAADTYTIHGIYLQNTGRINQAIENYNKALRLNPASRNAHYNLGLAYVNKKDFVRANEHAQQAYALGMTLPGLRNMLSKVGAWKPLPTEPPAPPAAQATPGNAPSEGNSAAK